MELVVPNRSLNSVFVAANVNHAASPQISVGDHEALQEEVLLLRAVAEVSKLRPWIGIED